MRWSRRTWYEGSHPESFAKAAHQAIEDAEKKSENALYRLLRGMNISGAQRLAGEVPLEEALRKTIVKQRDMDILDIVNESMNTRFRLPLYGKKGLADAVYAQASAQAASQATGNGAAAEDEVVEDADFEVLDEEEAAKS